MKFKQIILHWPSSVTSFEGFDERSDAFVNHFLEHVVEAVLQSVCIPFV